MAEYSRMDLLVGPTGYKMEFTGEPEAALVEAMYWHPPQTEDPANVGLRSVVQRLLTAPWDLSRDGTPNHRHGRP
ncbi:hypothetical protein [Paenarthrobacter nitroguajacolicus]|uniref:hypothetical protein n=1 Tax=Paenarthrobacter nitroguajacolicus TaxID=211146 RepID=UPI0040546B4C